jgi:parallel beta-helix repeat protein
MRNGFGIVLSSSDAKIFGNDVSGNECGVFANNSTGVEVGENNITGNGNGLRFERCFGDYVFNNTISFNGGFGFVLNGSSNCSVSGNSFLHNDVGLFLRKLAEGNNVVANNDFYGNVRGVFVEDSSNNSIVFNKFFANIFGATLSSCVNVTVSYNEFVSNNVGFVLNMSFSNGVYSNILSGNGDGVMVVNSFNNTCMFNVVSSNVGFGVYVLNSSFNVFLYNSFFNNSLVGSFNSSNFWDNGVEGNFWGYEGFVDDNRDGLGDFAFIIGEGERDNFPLMGEYAQFFANVDDNQYLISVISNSSVSYFVYFRDPENLTSVVSFKVGTSEGLGFCRVCLPHALVQPPFEVMVDNAAPLYYGVVKSNATHSWLYFAFPYIGGDAKIVTAVGGAPFWTEVWFWGIVGLAVAVGFLAIAVFLFYRRLSLYRKRIEEFERRLRERELSPLEVARRFFSADVERRSVKIGKFEEKYGVKIRPRDSLEDILRVLESKQKEKKNEEAE